MVIQFSQEERELCNEPRYVSTIPEQGNRKIENESVVFSEGERVDLKRYGWDPSRDLTEAELKKILDDAAVTPAEASDRLVDLMRHDPASPLRSTTAEE